MFFDRSLAGWGRGPNIMTNSVCNSEQLANDSRRAVDLLQELLRIPSVTPHDGGCQKLLARRLVPLGFDCQSMPYADVSNLWARRGRDEPLFCFAGHTDVVTPGDLDAWESEPFSPQIRDGALFGRGAVDMKGGLAAMVVATESFITTHKNFNGSLAFLITSDEEGPAVNGTRKVIDTLSARGESIDWCVVGEPSSSVAPGDVVRIGRRGSLTGKLSVRGTQGHVAYPEFADNPIHSLTGILGELTATTWDEASQHFPATSLQVVDVQSGTGADNVIPPCATATFNLRFSTIWNEQSLRKKIHSIAEKHSQDFQIEWQLSGNPFLCKDGALLQATVEAIGQVTGSPPQLSTGGGTSDGRFIAPSGAEVVELGLVNLTAHKANECTRIEHLGVLVDIYRRILGRMLL